MKRLILKKLILLVACVVLICACSVAPSEKAKSNPEENTHLLRIVSWNAQTFFDAVKDGSEYAEFKSSSSKWGKEAYAARLARLCEVIKKLDADVYVLVEIENESVVYDIANALAGGAWNARKNWNWACFSKIPGDALGCAVLSRYELRSFTSHALDIRVTSRQPSMRPLMKVSVLSGEKPLLLVVNHWKSMLGGKEETERWRDWQESVLATLIADSGGTPLVACGDFNRDIENFARGEGAAVIMRGAGFGETFSVLTLSPWLWEGCAPDSYSYYYQGEGSRIDHFFVSGANVSSFAAEAAGAWTENGVPKKYTVFSGAGYSDHLPISIEVTY